MIGSVGRVPKIAASLRKRPLKTLGKPRRGPRGRYCQRDFISGLFKPHRCVAFLRATDVARPLYDRCRPPSGLQREANEGRIGRLRPTSRSCFKCSSGRGMVRRRSKSDLKVGPLLLQSLASPPRLRDFCKKNSKPKNDLFRRGWKKIPKWQVFSPHGSSGGT
jgi:hypothetical protein